MEEPAYLGAEESSAPRDWGWGGPLIPVPGFGFLPARMAEELELMVQEFIREDFASISDVGHHDISVAEIAFFKCEMLQGSWPHFYPSLQDLPPEAVCPPLWDGASCLPPTPAGRTAVFPCMAEYNFTKYDTSYNASRACLPGADWANITNYASCSELCLDESGEWESCPINGPIVDGPIGTELSIHIYFAGYTISLLALLAALCIFICFREMRCLRHKIHIGLFLTFLLADLSWIFTALIQNLIHTDHYEVVVDIWCVSQVVLRYFHLTTFFWMFLEGLYLFLQVQFPLSLATVRHMHFLLIGWGGPLVTMVVWLVLRLRGAVPPAVPKTESGLHSRDVKVVNAVMSCPFLAESETDLYVYKIPVLCLLIINTFFLIWIMVIVVSKLHSRTAMDHDRRHYKAAKALVIVIPLLGFTYLLTLAGPGPGPAYTVFQAVRAALLSTQGFVISLPYCFLNTEVQGVLRNRWVRWKLVRNVGYECQTPKTSIYFAQGGYGGEKTNLMTTNVDSVFLTVPVAEPPTSKTSSRSISFSEIIQPLDPDGETARQHI